MRALSVQQPWAWAILHAGKNIENRSWRSQHATGTIAIHASSRSRSVDDLPPFSRRPTEADLVRGAIVGVVDVVGIVEHHRSRWFEGPKGWVLRNPRALKTPIPFSGRLGLWEVPSSVERRILQQLGRSRRRSPE